MDGISFVLSGKTLLIIIVILAILCLIFIIAYIRLLLLYKEARKDSIKDSLTRLFNKRYETQKLKEEISRAKRYGHSLQVALIDLDNFKEVNDTCGHKKGDKVLKRVADGLKQIIRRPYDIAIRHGGDEFVLILPEISSEEAEALCNRIIEMIENIKINGSIKISASIGIRSFDPKNPDADLMINDADNAMYLAKNGGKGKISVYEH
jgi:diguanylate cyclase (GGDEF)-like protein